MSNSFFLVDDIKKRWKSLRDTFSKYYRMELTNDSPLNSRKKPWRFYYDLEFLKPHVELFRLEETGNASVNAKNEFMQDSGIISCDFVKDSNQIQVVVSKNEHETTEYTVYHDEGEEEEEAHKEIFMDEMENFSNENEENQTDKNIEIIESRTTDDPDEKFLMSCLPVFKRLSARKNALLKLKIQTLLFEVEFGDDDGLSVKRPKLGE